MAAYLVTGGCGFIGSHLTDALLAKGHTVIVIDDLSSGRRENLAPEAELIVGDICDKNLLIDTLLRVDGCFHLAAFSGMVACKEDWLGTNRVNLVGTVTLFDAARCIAQSTHKIIPIVYASSCTVYGDSTDLPLSEQSLTIPVSAYGADKLACELQARIATQIHNIPTIGLRLFNVYGARQKLSAIDSAVIPSFIDRISKNEPLIIWGSGEQSRDFIQVADVVNHFIFFMENNQLSPAVFNVCTGTSTTINQLVSLIGQILGYSIAMRYEPMRSGDMLHASGDPSRAQALGVVAKISLATGIESLLTEMSIPE